MRIIFTLYLTCSLIHILPAQDTLVVNHYSTDTLQHMRIAKDSLMLDTLIVAELESDSSQEGSILLPVPKYVAVFDEEFENNTHNWDIVRSTRRGAEIKEGHYFLRGKSKSSPGFHVQPVKLDDDVDFRIETSILHHSGAKNMGFGLCWGLREDMEDYYTFLISANGKYTILRKHRGKYRPIKPWTESRTVKGSKKENVLSVQQNGNLFEYFINGRKVFSSQAEKLKGTRMGILYHGTMKLEVDYIRAETEVTEPQE